RQVSFVSKNPLHLGMGSMSIYTTGLKKLEAGKASILATIEPIVSAIVGLIFFQEVFDLTKILGMICIISAILILNLNLVKAKSIN
uniref:EamA family transporter n=1 Tax=Megamonas funiformis TaxID=437897 RepID=UPI0022DFDD0A